RARVAGRSPTLPRLRAEAADADVSKGNVIEHVAGETADGRTVYVGTRLKVAGCKITEVELNFHDRPDVNARNLVPYDPVFNTIVAHEERSTRAHLERIVT